MDNRFVGSTAIVGLFLCTATALAAPKEGRGNGRGGDDTDQASPACADLGVSMDVRNDSGSPYCHGSDGVQAFIGHLGRFKLDTSKSSSRQLVVNFPGCDRLIASTGADCLTPVVLNTLGEWEDLGFGLNPTGNNLDLNALAIGGRAYADFLIAFPSSISKSTPNLVFFGGSNMGVGDCPQPLTVTRVGETQWTIESVAEIGCLYEVTHKSGRREVTDSFVLPFIVTITLQ